MRRRREQGARREEAHGANRHVVLAAVDPILSNTSRDEADGVVEPGDSKTTLGAPTDGATT
jgi:hypothetical protein